MKQRLLLRALALAFFAFSLALALGTLSVASTSAAGPAPFTRQISSGGSTTPVAANSGSDGLQDPETIADIGGDDAAGAAGDPNGPHGVNRSLSGATRGNGRPVNANGQAKANPELGVSFDGLNFRQQRLANGGNQFSVEPPDQGMCAGNGFVVETVNDVFRVFHPDGTPATGVVDLNTFYGYAAAINRTTGVRGPEVTDPSCLFDQSTQRFFNVVLTLEVKPTAPSAGRFLGPNHIDIAVSNTSDPTGAWTIYRVPVQDDGTDGTPDHQCQPSSNPPPPYRTNPRACIGDYPHIGADANGFYVETNEYDLFGNGYHGSQIYAFSKAGLASLASSVTVTQFDTATMAPDGKPGFTIWPAQSPANQFDSDNGGTEFFLSSTAADEAQCASEAQGCSGNGMSSNILLWSLTNTSSLNASSPALSLSNQSLAVDEYAIPPRANQKAGNVPLADCFNDDPCSLFLVGITDPYKPEVEGVLDSNDTRMQQVSYANGKVWGALDTDIIVGGAHKAGIEYFAVNPNAGKLALQGTLALAGNNLIYPAIAVLPNGRGVMAFTVSGNDHYPSAGYAGLDAILGAGDVHIAAAGVGPQDGFTEYRIESPFGNGVPRPRWGDYGAAATDGNSIWIASEYIGQTCTFAQYMASPFGSCGGTRASLGNWDTRISNVTP